MRQLLCLWTKLRFTTFKARAFGRGIRCQGFVDMQKL